MCRYADDGLTDGQQATAARQMIEAGECFVRFEHGNNRSGVPLANGKGVASSPSAGANNRIVGVALQSGSSGESIKVLVAPGLKQG